MPKPVKPATPARPSSPPDAEAAYDALEPELVALESDELATINLDVPQVTSLVLGAVPGIDELSDEIVKLIDPRHVHNLRNYALAAWYAHLQALPPTKSALRALIEEATELRNTLLGDAENLARRGYFDSEAVAIIRAGQGHVDLANDLVALAAMFTHQRDEIAGKTPATEAEIARARKLGPELISALGKRDRNESASFAADRRARAFTLLVRAYDQVRRALTFLRWNEGDADVIAPSLYKSRNARSKGLPVEPPTEQPSNGAGTPEPPPAVTPAPAPVVS